MRRAIYNGRFIIDGEVIDDCVLLFDEKIIAIADDLMLRDRDAIELIDAKGNYVSAGFIDLHIHGSMGVDVMDATPKALHTLSKALLATGTTSFLATTMTMSAEEIDRALANIQAHGDRVEGAEIVGVHLEGPFINIAKHGAQDPHHIQEPNFDLIAPYMEIIKMITLAPEVAKAREFIQRLHKEYPHIIVSIGHSEASFEEAMESFAWGVSHATHLFNAMPSYHHRSPSIVGAVFASEVTCDVIADLIHTHPSTLDLVYRMKGERLMLITDAMRAGCMACGEYHLGGQEVLVEAGRATLADGTLAGSLLRMNEAMANMLTHSSMELVDVVLAVTKTPAKRLGISKGDLKEGLDADIVIFDENFEIIETIVSGVSRYRKGEKNF
jgi:N-acetylglucosamine-6-phosphate deacetylase